MMSVAVEVSNVAALEPCVYPIQKLVPFFNTALPFIVNVDWQLASRDKANEPLLLVVVSNVSPLLSVALMVPVLPVYPRNHCSVQYPASVHVPPVRLAPESPPVHM